jgi:hypothetical protein
MKHVKLSKCEFWMKHVAFLSNVISEEGIFVDLRKIQYLLSWNAPISDVDIHSSLGLVGYYRRFIKGISKITKPMTKLLGRDEKFKWTLAYCNTLIFIRI